MASDDAPEPEPRHAPDHETWADVLPLRRNDHPVDRPVGLRDLIGEVLREERHRQGRTLADVASAAAVSLPYLSEVERGRKDVSSDLLDAVHEALGLELVDVLERATRRLRVRSEGGNGLRMLAA